MIRPHTAPWPGFWDIGLLPKAYGALLYQVMGLPLGIAAFTWVVTGFSLSLGLSVIGVGLVLGLGFVAASRALAVAQGSLVAFLSEVQAPAALVMPEGTGFWNRLGALLKDPASWGAQAYLLLRLPMGIAGFTVLVTLFSLSASSLVLGLLPWHQVTMGPDGITHFQTREWSLHWELGYEPVAALFLRHQALARFMSVAAGVFGFFSSLHVALALTRAEAWLASALLCRKSVPDRLPAPEPT